MAFDGFITKSIIEELKPHLIGGKVNKVFEPTKNDIILSIYNAGSNYALELSANPDTCRIGLTTYSKPNPQVAPNFCMLLRKYLIGARIVDISNMDLERTVQIKFEAYNELNDLVIRKLFVEIMSRQSNIILTNENNIIIDTLKHVETSNRELLPAHEFEFTAINKESFINLNSFDEFKKILENSEEKTLSKAVPTLFIGFSKNFILNILATLKISDSDYSMEDLEKFYNHIKEILANIGTEKVSCMQYENDYTLALQTNTEPLNINFFIDDFYYKKESSNVFTSSRNNLLRIISGSLKKVSKKLDNINSKLKECSNMDTYKLYGELLTANLYKIKNSPNLDKIEIENYYDNNNLITIPLDKSISVHKNIDKYFKKYNKLKNALSIVTVQKEETEKELDYIQSIVFSLESAKTLSDINEVFEEISENIVTKKEIAKKQKNKPSKKKSNSDEIEITPIIIDGYSVYIGKNNIQNDYLSLKFADKNDYWFHTQKIHGSHIILRTNGNIDVPDEVLTKCAELAKENSKASNSSNVPVDFCLARYVKKASGAKPGMVIYTNYKTIYIR
jgi:predicted ribosome quality control (RQC) complex YloA/Tae2 family protein